MFNQEQAHKLAEDMELPALPPCAYTTAEIEAAFKAYALEAIAAALVKLTQQEPVAWIDEFGNVYPLAARRGPSWVNEHQRNWKPLYTHPTIPSQQEERVRELEDVLLIAMDALDEVSGNINPERGYCDELETQVAAAIAAINALRSKEQGK